MTPAPFALSLSKGFPSLSNREEQGFDSGRVRMSPGHSQPCRGHGGPTTSPNGWGDANMEMN